MDPKEQRIKAEAEDFLQNHPRQEGDGNYMVLVEQIVLGKQVWLFHRANTLAEAMLVFEKYRNELCRVVEILLVAMRASLLPEGDCVPLTPRERIASSLLPEDDL